jgi:putative transposase
MARSLRIEFEGALYHVYGRGQRRESIFVGDRDREHYLELLAEMVERFGVRMHAYVLMGNHYHLLFDTPRGNLSKSMKMLNTSYANWFKAKHRVVGSILQGRYHAVLVDRDAYLGQVSAYLHLNPERAGMVERAEAYPWSSYRYYRRPKGKPAWLTTDVVLGLFGGSPARYRWYVEQWRKVPKLSAQEIYGRGGILGGMEFVGRIRKRMAHGVEGKGLREITGGKRLSRISGEDVRGILERMGPKGEDDLFGKRRGNVWRKLLIYGLKRHTDASLREIGEKLGMDYAAVAQAYARIRRDAESRSQERKYLGRFEEDIQKLQAKR